MKAAVSLTVSAELATHCVNLPCVYEISLKALGIVVWVNEIFAGVVRGIDVNHPDLAEVRFLQELQYFETVAFNDQIPCALEVDALLFAGQERAESGSLDRLEAVALSRPVHAIALFADINGFSKDELQPFKINLATLGTNFWEQAQQFLLFVLSNIVRTQVELFGLLRGHISFLNSAKNALASKANCSARCRAQSSNPVIGRPVKLGSMNCCSNFCGVI